MRRHMILALLVAAAATSLPGTLCLPEAAPRAAKQAAEEWSGLSSHVLTKTASSIVGELGRISKAISSRIDKADRTINQRQNSAIGSKDLSNLGSITEQFQNARRIASTAREAEFTLQQKALREQKKTMPADIFQDATTTASTKNANAVWHGVIHHASKMDRQNASTAERHRLDRTALSVRDRKFWRRLIWRTSTEPLTPVPFEHPAQHVAQVCRYSEAYPSRGGPDCPSRCAAGTYSQSQVISVASAHDGHLVNLRLLHAIRAARARLGRFGTMQESTMTPHMSFLYFCCLTSQQHAKVNSMVEALYKTLPPLPPISFSRAACRLDKPTPHMSIILLADDKSNQALEQHARLLEEAVVHGGVELSYRRSELEPFHVTLGTIVGTDAISGYAFHTALSLLNGDTNWPSLAVSAPFAMGHII